MTETRRKADNNSALIVEPLDEATAILTLNRPERRNALSIELMKSICGALQSLASQRCRAVILRGNGPAFCSGLDLREVEVDREGFGGEWVARTFELLATTPMVTLAAAHGAAYAGGAGLLACCDFVIAADDLKVGFPEVHRGLVPALVAALLHDRMLDRDLRELLLLGEPVDAQRALQIGLIQRVVAADSLMDETRTLLASLLRAAPEAVRQTKRLLAELGPIEHRQQWSVALEFHHRARQGAEAREGLAAFRERREPNWPRDSETPGENQ